MNFEQANKICKKYFGKPKIFGSRFLFPYAEYSSDIKYPYVFSITLNHNNSFNIILSKYGYKTEHFTLFYDNYTNYNKKDFEKIIYNFKNIYKFLKELNSKE